jgi:hypothetical protein
MIRFLRTALPLLSPCLLLFACQPVPTPPPTLGPLPAPFLATSTVSPSFSPVPTISPGTSRLVPDFTHIVMVVFENREFETVIGNPDMAYFNILAGSYTLLTQHYAITHPSLPNYISMVSGDTFGIVLDCNDCFIDAPSLPDLIEASGRSWKTYQDDMPEPCFVGDTLRYFQKHNPFIYFDSIRLDANRCLRSIVPLTDLEVDLTSGSLPNFIFITPDICYSAHDCALEYADGWLHTLMDQLVLALDATGSPYLIVLTWDEGQGTHGCCGLPDPAGGRVATILVSPQVRSGFKDSTPYTHYSLLKTISEAWGLPYLGHAADEATVLITAPWR